jgi:hypothetical protein
MSSVQFSFHKLRLAAQLRAPGGLAVADALEAVQANLAKLAPTCLTELQTATSAAIAAFQDLPDQYDGEALAGLYAVAARAVGLGAICGAPNADLALVSLCSLVDHFCVSGRWSREAIGVHLQTLQLLVSGAGQPMDPAASEHLLAGLKKVSARYAEAPASAAASGSPS